MAYTTLNMIDPETFAARLTAGMDDRTAELGTTLSAVAAGIGKDPRQLRAWRAGSNMPSLAEAWRLDEYFAGLGCPGLLDDIRRGSDWLCTQRRLVAADLPGQARKLFECAAELRSAPSLMEGLAERGLLPHVHLMLRTPDDKVRILHRGSRMKSAATIDESVYGRDIRELEPRGYGLRVYPQMMEVVGRAKPALWDIKNDDASYKRLAVPVGSWSVCLSFDIEFSPAFRLS